MILPNIAGLMGFLAVTAGMLWLVPHRRIRSLFPLGLVFGFGLALLLLHFMQNAFGYWQFMSVDLFYIQSIPVFVSLTWLPGIIMFAHFIQEHSSFQHVVALILLFAGIATIAHYLFMANGMLVYNNWSLAMTFGISAAIHIAISLYMYGAELVGKEKKPTY